jgi:hypothetical protein
MSIVTIIVGCASQPPLKSVPSFIGRDQNACLPEAAAMAEGLKKEGIQAEVVVFTTDQRCHAICAYLYPTGSNQLWGWDSYNKSNMIRAWLDDADGIAKDWLLKTDTSEDTETLQSATLE